MSIQRALQLIHENKKSQASFLDLGNLGLTELPEELWELKHLERLNLAVYYYDEEKKRKESQNKGAENRLGSPKTGSYSVFRKEKVMR